MPSADPPGADGTAPDRPLPPRLRQGLERMADELRLEGERRQRFLDVQRSFFAATFEAEARRRRAERALRRELFSAAPDSGRAEARLAEVVSAHRDLEQAFLDNYFATRELLGPDQQRLFRRLMRHVRRLRDDLRSRQRQAASPRLGERAGKRRPNAPPPG